MAKKLVRGITDIKTITKQDFDTNNVNDILSDGEYSYIHRKKGKTEEYHNLTDNLKTLSSENTDLLTVTNNNKTNNTATLSPKHDGQKEQLIESTRNTVTINHGANGTSETTKLDTNPEKVLEHDNLLTDYGISRTFNNNTTTLGLQPKKVSTSFNVNNLFKGKIIGENLTNSPSNGWFVYENDYMELNGRHYVVQNATRLKLSNVKSNEKYTRSMDAGSWSSWDKQLTDEIILAKKQNTITNNTSIGVNGSGLQQLYSLKQTYSVTGGLLKTHVKSVAQNTSVSTPEEEFNFIAKINQGVSSVNFTLNTKDTTKFTNIMNTYGSNNTVQISGCVFTLSGSTLTVSTANNTEQNYVITFSDII